MKLLYRGSRDGFAAKNFHDLCDLIGPTLTIVKSTTNFVFGGYTPLLWHSYSQYIRDPNYESFLFSVNNKTIHPTSSSLNYKNSIYGY